jgi:hypothetical protein
MVCPPGSGVNQIVIKIPEKDGSAANGIRFRKNNVIQCQMKRDLNML